MIIERDAWLISGKHNFPGPWDFRFMYQEADDYDCGSSMMNLGTDGMFPNNCGRYQQRIVPALRQYL